MKKKTWQCYSGIKKDWETDQTTGYSKTIAPDDSSNSVQRLQTQDLHGVPVASAAEVQRYAGFQCPRPFDPHAARERDARQAGAGAGPGAERAVLHDGRAHARDDEVLEVLRAESDLVVEEASWAAVAARISASAA
jgi:hypothetical protein